MEKQSEIRSRVGAIIQHLVVNNEDELLLEKFDNQDDSHSDKKISEMFLSPVMYSQSLGRDINNNKNHLRPYDLGSLGSPENSQPLNLSFKDCDSDKFDIKLESTLNTPQIVRPDKFAAAAGSAYSLPGSSTPVYKPESTFNTPQILRHGTIDSYFARTPAVSPLLNVSHLAQAPASCSQKVKVGAKKAKNLYGNQIWNKETILDTLRQRGVVFTNKSLKERARIAANSGTELAGKRSVREYFDINSKAIILHFIETNKVTLTTVATAIHTPQNTLSTWKRNASVQGALNSLKSGKKLEINTHRNSKIRKTSLKVSSIKQKIYKILHAFVVKSRAERYANVVTAETLRVIARKFEEVFGESLNVDQGNFISRFIKRLGLKRSKLHGISAAIGLDSKEETRTKLKEFKETNQQLIHDYPRHLIYNADESGLFWKQLPTYTYTFETQPKGTMAHKSRYSFMVACNSDGSHKIATHVVGRSKTPKNEEGHTLASIKDTKIQYLCQENAWYTKDIFEQWLAFFSKEVARRHGKDSKALLLVDNASCHKKLSAEFKNVKVVYLPANTTSFLQPIDQGIVNVVKSLYKKEFLQHIVNDVAKKKQEKAQNPHSDRVLAKHIQEKKIEDEQPKEGETQDECALRVFVRDKVPQLADINECVKSFGIVDSFSILERAWNNVTSECISKCWKPFYKLINNSSVDEFIRSIFDNKKTNFIEKATRCNKELKSEFKEIKKIMKDNELVGEEGLLDPDLISWVCSAPASSEYEQEEYDKIKKPLVLDPEDQSSPDPKVKEVLYEDPTVKSKPDSRDVDAASSSLETLLKFFKKYDPDTAYDLKEAFNSMEQSLRRFHSTVVADSSQKVQPDIKAAFAEVTKKSHQNISPKTEEQNKPFKIEYKPSDPEDSDSDSDDHEDSDDQFSHSPKHFNKEDNPDEHELPDFNNDITFQKDEGDKSELHSFEDEGFPANFSEVVSSAEKTKLLQATVAVKVSPSLFTSTSKKTSKKRLFSETETNEPTLPTIGQTKKPEAPSSDCNYFYSKKVYFQEFPDMLYHPLNRDELLATQARVERFVNKENVDSIVVFPQDNLSKNLKNFIPKEVRKIDMDGNCFYRAISFALYRTQCYYKAMRAFMVAYMEDKLPKEKNSQVVLNFLDIHWNCSLKDYLDQSRVRLDTTWATQFEIAVMAKALDLNIAVYMEQDIDKVLTGKWNIFNHTGRLEDTNFSLPQILLYNKSGNHFEYVVTVQSAPLLHSQVQPCLNKTIDISDSSVVASPHSICPKSSEKKKKVLKKRKRVRPKKLSDKSILEALDDTNEKCL